MSVHQNTSAPVSLLAKYAKRYYSAGMPPLVVRPNDKKAALPGWQKMPIKEVLFSLKSYRNSNLGIAMPESLMALDIDCKAGCANGYETLIALEKEHTKLPDTLTQTTPSGGEHRIFKLPSGVTVKNAVGFAPGLDTRVKGGLIVVAPSIIDGRSYTWRNWNVLSENPPTIAEAPNWLIKLCQARKNKPNSSHKNGIPKGKRNDSIFRYAIQLKSNGVSFEEAQILVFNVAANCQPPLNEKEALSCLESAWRYSQNLHCTDIGNAKRLVISHGYNIRYIHAMHKWLLWDSNRWVFDGNGGITRLAKETVLGIYTEVTGITDDTRRIKTSKWAANSESLPRLAAMIELAKSEPGIQLRPEELDHNEILLGVLNGTLDLRSGNMREPQREDYISKTTCIEYNPAAKCPNWLSFLDTIMSGDISMMEFLQRVVGYCLTGHTKEQCLFLLYGTGANGKSTFVNILRDILGTYGANTPAETFMVQQGRGPRNDIARLHGIRLATAIETEDDHRLAESLVKSLTGDDTISARFLYSEYFDFRPQFKLFLAANHRPIIKGNDNAIWRRVRLIPFDFTIPPEKQDKDLSLKLHSELSGILNWAIEGCLTWQRDGLQPPNKVLAATKDYRDDMDFLKQFIDECCDLDPCATTGATELYNSYLQWAKQNTGWNISQTIFGRKLVECGFEKKRTPRVCYLGIKLKDIF